MDQGVTSYVPFNDAPPVPTDALTMPGRIAAFDWAAHPLGSRDNWSAALTTTVDLLLASDVPMTLYWGPDYRIIFNDSALPGFGDRAIAIGDRAADVWGDWWPQIRGQFREVEQTRRSVTRLDVPFIEPHGNRTREIYWNLTFWPVLEDGVIVGILCAARNVTDEVFSKRSDRLIVDLDNALAQADTVDEVMQLSLGLIAVQLGVRRAGFGEVADGQVDIKHVWADTTMPDFRGTYPLGTFGDISDMLARGETVIIDDAQNDARIADAATKTRYQAMNLRAGLVVPIIERGRYAGGIFVQDAETRQWTPFEVLLAEAATRRLWAALVRLRTDIALRDREQRYRLVFEQAEDIIFTADTSQRITDCNTAGARALGLAREDIVGRSIADFVSAQGFEQTSAMLQQKIEHGGNTRHEIAVRAPDGRTMLWENNSTLIRDLDDKPIGLLSISRDVTERRAFDERRELLIHELNHRVKNTLSLVQGLAYQTFRAGHDSQAAATEFLSRLSALAVAHDLLTREQWEGATIAELVRGATAHAAERIEAGGAHLLVSPKSAVALVMALHELTTNAIKYGALSNAAGRATIEWRALGDDRFHLNWRESGGPRVSPPSHRGFGVRMIERVLASDLGGTVQLDFSPTGVVCTIEGAVVS